MRIRRGASTLLLSPLAFILVCGVVIPAGVLLVYSFYRYDFFQLSRGFHLDEYRQVLSQSVYRTIAWNTLAISVPTTAISLAGGYAIAYFLASVIQRGRAFVFALVIVSMLASYLARVYAWRTLMGSQGIINTGLQALGVIHSPLGWLLFSRVAIISAEVNLYMPVATLILYAALAGIPGELREVSRDLGAGRFQTLRRITLPLSGRAVFAAAALTFFLSSGDYITPEFLGGPSSSQTFGTVIATQITMNGNYPLGAAMSFVMTGGFIVYIAVLFAGMRTTRLLPRSAE